MNTKRKAELRKEQVEKANAVKKLRAIQATVALAKLVGTAA